MAVGLGSTFEEVIKKINSCGDVTAAGNNTFTGSNVFKKAVTLYTDAVNGNSISATLDSYKLKLFNDLGSVYADLNITDDTAPYLELKTAGYGKVKYTPESIIFTDTYGSSKTTTLKFPGQGATADSIQTLATLKDLDAKQETLVSGENIKTINGQSILGKGDLEISGGGSGSNEPVLISVASTNSYRTDPLDQLSQHNIRVRVISGTLQVGDRLEICRPIAKKSYNRVNGVKKNVRWKQKLKACAYKIITEADIANIAAGKDILVLTVNHSTDQPNRGLEYTCTSNYSTFRGSAPRVIRIVRPTPYGQNGIMQNIQISNSVYVTRSNGSNVIKGM